MAKQKFDLDPYGFDSSLDMPDFDFEPGKATKDRKPLVTAAKAAARGAKSTVASPSFIRKMILAALPKGYGDAANLASDSASTIKGLYNDSVTEIKPVINDIKRTTKRILPNVESKLPRKMADKIKKWSEGADAASYKQLTPEQQRDAALQMQLGQLFQFTTEDTIRKENETKARSYVQEGIDHNRHRDTVGQLDAMRISLQQLASYQHKVNSNFQRKSLELQFRHYFVAQDALAEQKKQNAIVTTNLEGILKNTGLPDFLKLTQVESAKQIVRNKFMESMNDNIFSKRNEFIKNLTTKLAAGLKEKIRGITEGVRMGLDAAEFGADGLDMAKDFGMSGADIVGEKVGEFGANAAGKWVGGKIKKHMPKKMAQRINKFGNKLEYGVKNAPQLITDWSNGDTSNKDSKGFFGKAGALFNPGRPLGGLGDILRDAIKSTNSVSKELTTDKAGSMQDPDHFSRGASKSITEVIPGYLARIYRELQIMRTGNTKQALTSYDFTTNRFADKDTVTKNILKDITGIGANNDREKQKQIDLLNKKKTLTPEEKKQLSYLKSSLGKSTATYTKEQIDELINEVDTEKKLSPEQREVLGKQMLHDNLKGKSGSLSRLSNKNTYGGNAKEHADVFSSLFSEYAKGNVEGGRQLRFADKFSDIGRYAKDGRKETQDHLNTGNLEILEELGLIDPETNSINLDKLREYSYDGSASKPNSGIEVKQTRHKLGQRNKQGGMRQIVSPAASRQVNQFSQATNDRSFESSNSTDELIKEIKDSSSRTIAETISETLLRIEKKINDGIDLHGGPGGEGSEGQKSGGRWWNKSIKDAASGIGKGAFDLAGKGISAGKNLAGKLYGAGKSIGGFGFNIGSRLLSAAKEKILGAKDIFVKGDMGPRLLAWKLKAGHYKDEVTGKIITKYKDIKGNVIDEEGNVVLSAKEIKDSFVKSGIGSKLISGLGSILSGARELGKNILFNIPPLVRFGINLVQRGFGLLKLPEDVYVVGKPDPVLLAVTMKVGGYASRVTSKEIRSPADIDGPVVDNTGNIVLTAEDIAKGLLNKHGKPLRTGLGKLTGFAKDVFNYGKDKVKKSFNFVKNKAFALGRGIKTFALHGIGGFRSGRSGGSDGVESSDPIIARLTEIRDILSSRLPKSKGIRKGSYEDIVAERKKALADKLAAAKDKMSETGMGIKGLLGSGMAGLASLFGFGKGKKDKEETDEDGNIIGETAADYAGMKAVDKAGSWTKKGWAATKKFGAKGLKFLGGKGKIIKGAVGLAAGAGGLSAASKGGLSLETAAQEAGRLGKGAETATKAAQVGGRGFGVGMEAAKLLKSPAGRILGKSLAPLMALMSVGEAGTDLYQLGTGKKNIGDWDKENGKFGFSKMLSPWEAGKYIGNKTNERIINPAMAKLTGDPTATLGSALFDGVDKLTRAITGAKDPNAPITLEDVNKYRAAKGKPPLTSLKPQPKAGSNEAIKNLANGILDKDKSENGMKPVNASATNTPVGSGNYSEGRVSALDTIRYKTYGLVEMESDKIRAIVNLESIISKELKYNKNHEASWSGDLDKVITSAGPLFGIEGVRTNQGYRMASWFNARFLPTYLNYASSVHAASSKPDPAIGVLDLKPQQLVDTATLVYTTKGVWKVDATPWPRYEINTDMSSIDKNIQSLKDDVKKNVLPEKASSVDVGVDVQKPTKAAGAPASAPSDNWWNKSADKVKEVYGAVKETAKNIYGFGKEVATKAYNNAVDVTSNGMSSVAAAFSGGSEITHPGAGSGGDINSLPKPTGDGSYKHFKDLIAGAAKMVGVDEKLMATMAAIESGFKATVKAGTSSATGLYQFISSTWNTMLKKYGAKYGIAPGTLPTDPRANALMGAEFIKENAKALQGVKSGPLTDTDLYIAHFMGAGGARKFLKSPPDAIAANMMPDAARANKNIFYEGGNVNTPRTVAQVYAFINELVKKKSNKFGFIAETGPSGADKINAAMAGSNVSNGNAGGDGSTKPSGSMPPTPVTDSKGLNSASMSVSDSGKSSIPVSDVAPSATAAIKPVSAPTTTSDQTSAAKATSGPTPGDPALAAASSGFLSPRAQDLSAQRQFQKDTSDAVLTGIGETLKSSLSIDQSQLDVLQKIFNLMVSNGNSKGTPGADASKSAVTNGNNSGDGNMVKPPISMRRGYANG